MQPHQKLDPPISNPYCLTWTHLVAQRYRLPSDVVVKTWVELRSSGLNWKTPLWIASDVLGCTSGNSHPWGNNVAEGHANKGLANNVWCGPIWCRNNSCCQAPGIMSSISSHPNPSEYPYESSTLFFENRYTAMTNHKNPFKSIYDHQESDTADSHIQAKQLLL